MAIKLLISVQDGKQAIKIIDFGVAKALAQRLTGKTMFTEMGMLVGTPEYMSPERYPGGDAVRRPP